MILNLCPEGDRHTISAPGDYYEDCSYYPRLGVSVDSDGEGISVISLVDGSYLHNCSAARSGVRKCTL